MTKQTQTALAPSIGLKKIVLCHPSGNEAVRGALYGVQAAGLLDSFYTSFACFPGSTMEKIASAIPVLAEIKKRTFAETYNQKHRRFPFANSAELLLQRWG